MISKIYNEWQWNARHLWPEKQDFHLSRPNGLNCYTFIHFHQPIKFRFGGEFIVTEPHACIVISPHTAHEYHAITPFVNDWIHFDSEYAEYWTKCNLKFNKFYYPKSYNFISEEMQTIEAENKKKEFGHEIIISSTLSKLFILLGRSLDNPFLTNTINERRIRYLRQEMFSHLNEEWTIERMAKTINMSRAYIDKYYKIVYGISPVKDLINARISKCQTLLSQTNLTISEIAEELGYKNLNFFSRQFKNITGVSPRNYRKNLQ